MPGAATATAPKWPERRLAMTKAARSIHARLTERFGGRTPTPQEVLADDPDELRAAAGL